MYTVFLIGQRNIGKISIYKHCFCYSNVPIPGTKDPLLRQPISRVAKCRNLTGSIQSGQKHKIWHTAALEYTEHF